ncbi:MAG: carboxypeptidase-like regulatory domain-containing protein [Bacteroidota bacterium]
MNSIHYIFLLAIWGLLCLPQLHATDVLERRIDVSFYQTPMKEALREVAKKGGFEWSYNANILDPNKKVNLAVKDRTVREILIEMLGTDYSFKQSGEYLILKKVKKPDQRLTGFVTDPRTGKKIANATVYDRQTLRSTTTDSSGYYELSVTKRSEIVVSKLAYRDTILQVTSQTPRFLALEIHLDTVPEKNDPWERMQSSVVETSNKIERFFVTSAQRLNGLNVQDSIHRRFQISLLPKIGTNFMMSGNVENDLSINLLAGYSKGNHIAELAGLGNITRGHVDGIQAAGLFNEVKGDVNGIQVAGTYNNIGNNLTGVQAAGTVNVARHSDGSSVQVAGSLNLGLHGQYLAQSSGFANYCDTIKILQAAGLINIAKFARGVQAAGMFNFAMKGNTAVQAAGFLNYAGKGIVRVQIAGFTNVADTIKGVQVAGFVNRAQKVKGVQVGIVNRAKEIDGMQIGLLNFSRRGGYIVLELGANEVHWSNIAFKSGTHHLYTIFTAGLSPETPRNNRLWSYGAGVGTLIPLSRHTGLNIDLIHRHVNQDAPDVEVQEWEQIALGLDIRLGQHVSLAFGPSANLFILKKNKLGETDIIPRVVPAGFPQTVLDNDAYLPMWVGATAAVRIRF